jgi:Flp pilus assembly CpaE family ATPase
LACEVVDLIVVDLGFLDAAEWASILKTADALLLVAEPTELSMGMLKRYLAAVDSSGIDRARFQIVINRARRSDEEPFAPADNNLKQSFFARLPHDFRQVSEAVTLGIPLLSSSKSSLVGRYRDLAASLLAQPPRNEATGADSPADSSANTSVCAAAK